MILSEKIRNEKDPLMREIYALGFNEIFHEKVSNEMIIVNDKGYKSVPVREIALLSISINTAIMPDGEKHLWISEADGSAEKLRKLIDGLPYMGTRLVQVKNEPF